MCDNCKSTTATHYVKSGETVLCASCSPELAGVVVEAVFNLEDFVKALAPGKYDEKAIKEMANGHRDKFHAYLNGCAEDWLNEHVDLPEIE